jgi:hypothetical protein
VWSSGTVCAVPGGARDRRGSVPYPRQQRGGPFYSAAIARSCGNRSAARRRRRAAGRPASPVTRYASLWPSTLLVDLSGAYSVPLNTRPPEKPQHPKIFGSFPERRSRPMSEWPTYTANLCPIHCSGAASHPRARTTILHSESWDCKSFSWDPDYKRREAGQDGAAGALLVKIDRTKKEMKIYPSDLELLRPTESPNERLAVLKRQSARSI